VKSYLNVSVLVHEFDTAIKAFEVASDAAFHNIPNNVISTASLFVLIDKVLKCNSNHGYDSNNESTPCERSQVISENPFNRHLNKLRILSFTNIRSVSSEVPKANRATSNEELNGNNE